jgi:hypothetical protein
MLFSISSTSPNIELEKFSRLILSSVYLRALYLVLLQLQTTFADDMQFYCLRLITGDMTFLTSCVTLEKICSSV